jgi:hypothetical protein
MVLPLPKRGWLLLRKSQKESSVESSVIAAQHGPPAYKTRNQPACKEARALQLADDLA